MMQEQSVETGPGLERSIGLGRVVFQSVTTMAPGASVVFGLGLIMVYTGIAAPFAMLIGAFGAVIVAFCIGQLATRIPSAGGFYSYAAITFGNAFGFIVGWLYSALYVILVCVSGINFALVTQDFLSYYFHVAPPYWLLVAIIVLVILGVTYIGVRVSTGLAAILGIIEVGMILLLTIILIARAGDANSLALFNPAHAAQPGSSTLRSVFLGIVFAFAATAGFEACLPLAEEAKNPKRNVPLALMLSAGLIGAFYVLATYGAIVGWGPAHLSGYIDSPNAWRVMGGKISAVLAVLVSLAIINSTIGGEQSGYNAVSRLLFAMGRAATLPKALARIHAQRRTPYVAVIASGLLALALMYIAMALFSPFGAFVFFLTLGSFIFLILYTVIVIASTVYIYSRHRSEFSVGANVIAPILALCVLLPTLYYSLKGLDYPANRALPVLGVLILLGIGVLLLLRARGADISAERQHWLREDTMDQGLSTETASPAAANPTSESA
jgi:amino acid transporter